MSGNGGNGAGSVKGFVHEPIAIVGIGCRYSMARGPEELWRLLLEGRDAVVPYPGGRFRDLDAVYAERAKGSKVIASHLGGFLPEVDKFDAAFFGISPREAAYIDPQQRLLLEVSWDALEDAGQVKEQYTGSRTGVFTGLWTTDYETHIYNTTEKPEFYQITGGNRSTICGRVSFTFGFEGPSICVDTACSSSMVAIHLACQSLQLHECDMALGGGANIVLSTDVTRLFTNAGMLATDGHCKFGDKSANGFVRSEGAGMVVLKRLSDAQAAGDSIYAVIRGGSVNNDGSSSGYLVTPSRAGQKTMLEEAWRQAGITGADLSYIEAHGTGTQVGDPVELGAISDALRAGGVSVEVERVLGKVPVGSLKTNIGHTESAAGVAGTIKAALILHKGVIPGSLLQDDPQPVPNPAIDWAGGPVEIPRGARELKPRVDEHGVRKPLVVGASSFGLTGTNSHLVLGEVPAGDLVEGAVPAGFLLPITAYSPEALQRNAANWAAYLGQDLTGAELAAVCHFAGERRTHLGQRLAVVGRDAAELRGQIEAFLAGDSAAGAEAGTVGEKAPRVVFVAPGQGSQWDGMARDLLRDNAAFRESFTACDAAIAKETGWSLIERLESADAAKYLAEIDFVQPALFAMSVALAAVWRSVGVVPGAVVGHSMGEVAAAYLAGVLTLQDAAAVICRRSRLMRRLSGSGAMASVELPAAEMEALLGSFAGRVSIAAANSPGTTVVSGDAEAVDQLLEWLELKEIFCRRVKVDVASHSALVDPILGELAEELKDLQPRAGVLPLYSTVKAAYADGATMDAVYWVRNLREPVRLAAATTALVGEGFDCFIELSPHPVLVPALEHTLRGLGAGSVSAGIVLPSLLRGQAAWPVMLRSLGRYWTVGGKLDWAELNGRGGLTATRPEGRLRLPEYAFEHERFWEESDEPVVARSVGLRLSPMLLSRTEPAHEPGTSVFAVVADLNSLPYLTDHRVGGGIVVPAAAHVEAVLEAARVLFPAGRVRLSELEFKQAIYLVESASGAEAQELQLLVRRVPGVRELYKFSLLGRQGGGAGAADGGWSEHSSGLIELAADEAEAVVPKLDSVLRTGTKEEHYRKAGASGLEYGPAFQLLESFTIGQRDGAAAAEAVLGFADAAGYEVHPALLDCCFQVMIPLLLRTPGVSADDVYLPSALRELRVVRTPSDLPEAERQRLVTRAVFKGSDAEAGTTEYDIELWSESGALLVVAHGMTVQRVESRGRERVADGLWNMGWAELGELAKPAAGAALGKHWLIFADAGGRAAALAQRLLDLGGRSSVVWLGEVFRPLGAGERRLDLLGADEYELPLNDTAAVDRLLGLVAAEAGQIAGVIDCWALGDGFESGLEDWLTAQGRGSKFLPTLVQGITRAGWAQVPRLWIVTEGTQTVEEVPGAARVKSAPAWGMASVIMYEHPEFAAAVVDLSADGGVAETDALVRLLFLDEAPEAREDRLAVRGERVFAARMVPCPMPKVEAKPRALGVDEEFRVETGRGGSFETLPLRVMNVPVPGAGEVAIAVDFVALNFIDVTKAAGFSFGLDPKAPIEMGGECSGRVAAVGEGVQGLRVGDEVVALTTSPLKKGLLASTVILPAPLVLPKPAGLSQMEAAGLPIAYLTAYYSLIELGRMRRGEWVLIHAGAGGVGLAAIRIAQAAGARIIATASSPEKHAFLHGWGVEHVLQSRTLEFVEGVMEITGGKGVDIVLNSLSGDFIPASIEVLAPYGRFLELGKRDIYDDRRVGLKGFRRNISYFAVDLAAMVEEKPEYSAELFAEVVKAVAEGRWSALPVTAYPATEVSDALRFMAQGRHIGKLAIQFSGEGKKHWQALPKKMAGLFSRDASYLITGGLGGVGAAVAEWMAANGAGNLVLVSRRAAGAEELEVMRRVRAAGALVEHRRTDLVDAEAVRRLVAEIGATMLPLKGILHAAAAIDDALVVDLRPKRFDAVYGPKIRGTWNLHEATLSLPRDESLDFFLMFSSIAVPFPQLGHGSYSAANAFMDSFAAYRRGLGLPATSINWGGWRGLGLARELGTSRTIGGYDAAGLGSFDRDEALHVLGEALKANPRQAVALSIDRDAIAASYEVIPTLLRGIVGADKTAVTSGAETKSGELTVPEELAAMPTVAERSQRLEELLRTETSRVLKLAPEKIKANQPFGQMGIDSLMALEFIRRVNAGLGLALPATAVFNYPTLTQLTAQVLKRLGLDAVVEVQSVQATPKVATLEPSSKGPDELSDEEALRALMEPGEFSGD